MLNHLIVEAFLCHWYWRYVLSRVCHSSLPHRSYNLPYLLDVFLSSNSGACVVIFLRPLRKSDHGIICVDVSFAANAINDHPYHRTVYHYDKADWDWFRDHLRYVPWFLKSNVTHAAKEVWFSRGGVLWTGTWFTALGTMIFRIFVLILVYVPIFVVIWRLWDFEGFWSLWWVIS